MFTTIVVGTDDSPTARRAVEAAGELARRFGVETVHVVCGYRPISEPELAHLAHDLPEEFRMGLSADQGGLAQICASGQHLTAMGLTPVRHLLPTSGAEAMLDVADQVGADLIVVGSHGYGAGQRLLHGSVSNKVAHHAPCSVLIVHER